MSRGFNGSAIKCCTPHGKPVPEDKTHPECRAIRVPDDDPFYAPLGVVCMNFVRSTPAPRVDCSLGPREQMNQATSCIDASNVYGSTKVEADKLRLFSEGESHPR